MSFDNAAGAASNAIAALGQSIVNANAAANANQTNIDIANMNNEWSERMMNKQLAANREQWEREAKYNTDMWNKTNEYNSAKNQAARLKEAGLNPAIVMSGANAGTASASSAPSGNSVGLPSPSQARVEPVYYNGISDAISNAMQLNSSISRQNAETEWLNTQSDVAKAKAAKEIADLVQNIRGKKFQNDLNDATESILVSIRNENYLNELQKRLNAEEQGKMMRQQQILTKLEIEGFPQRFSMDLAVMASQVDLNKHNAQSEVGKIIDTLKKKGYKFSKDEEKRIFEAVIQDIETQQYRGLNLQNGLIGILNR